ncbi:MAG: hypothetical protein QNK42_18495 [Pseudodonghicola sp.]|nr:hypothetical protein [Pseudodonghicola sp.]
MTPDPSDRIQFTISAGCDMQGTSAPRIVGKGGYAGSGKTSAGSNHSEPPAGRKITSLDPAQGKRRIGPFGKGCG